MKAPDYFYNRESGWYRENTSRPCCVAYLRPRDEKFFYTQTRNFSIVLSNNQSKKGGCYAISRNNIQ